jgi:predicted NBD/HSP70 family sugar kinase
MFLGIDLGGTKIEGALIDPERPGEAIHRLRHPTEAAGGYDHILGQVQRVVDDLRACDPARFPAKLGIGTPGTLDPKTQRLRGSNTQCLNGRPLKADLEALLGMPVEIANDANCFALAEATWGAGAGHGTVFGIIMGTGCGGGFVVNGHLLHGCHGIAGEWGQMVIEPDGELSGYGTRGIVECYIAGPALEKFYEQCSGTRLGLREIAGRTATDPAAAATIERLKDYFPRALAYVINTFDPEAIVIGGGVGNLDVLYSDEVRERIGAAIFAPTFEAALLKPRLGDSAGVFGAAMLTAE